MRERERERERQGKRRCERERGTVREWEGETVKERGRESKN